ncbi:MAG: dihydropyrimidinase [Candidatus Marinimicrobia bacterium]|nr:dihydropyrimidinase [Candidatus Neomarinimicrobiota bacterium]
MEEFDLVLRNGRVANAGDEFEADVGVRDGVIVAIEKSLMPGKREIDADGRWVLPGGIDSHCHVEQLSAMGMMCADDFYSATVSAAFGGTTTIIPFAAQHRAMKISEVVADYAERARKKAVIDYGFHLILANPDDTALITDLPEAIRNGITSLKVYMTYDRLRLDDHQLLDVLTVAAREQALVMVHAENHDMIRWIVNRLVDRAHTAPKFHAVAHDPIAESEATNRAIALSRLLGVPLLIVHVSGREAIHTIRRAKKHGAAVYAETCPQYLFLTAEDLDRDGMDGAMFCCSPPPRDKDSQEAVWDGIKDGTLPIYSSDHAPYRFDASGKLPKGKATTFKEVANGVPGLELRMPLLFSEGVMKKRISIKEFVALTATNHAEMYGLTGRKGEIAVGADADIGIWNPDREVTVTASKLHDNAGYTPYEGHKIRGWPEVVISRGRIVVENNTLNAERGSGMFLKRNPSDMLRSQVSISAAEARRTLRNLIDVGEKDGRS